MERMFRDRTMESEEKLMVKEFGILTAMLKQLKQFQGERLELDQNTLREKDNKETIKAVEEKLSLARQKVEKSARDWEEKKQTCQQQNEVLWDKKEYYKKTAQKAESARKMAITKKQEMSALLQAQSMELAAAEACHKRIHCPSKRFFSSSKISTQRSCKSQHLWPKTLTKREGK